jgi:hypothetical protein
MSFLSAFREVFGDDIPDVETHKIRCIWHDETAPSLTLYIHKGEYHCYGCGRGGKIEELVSSGDPIIDMSQVLQYQDRLWKEPAMIEFLRKVRGLDDVTIREYMLGYNGARVTIPVFNSDGHCVNIRLYKPGGKGNDKVISFGAGYGKVRLFPRPPNGDEHKVFLMEGEMDCLLARKMGLPAFSTTGGSKSWNDQLSRYMFGKDVVLVYDTDREGRAGARAIIDKLKICTASARNTVLPTGSNSKDFTEWVMHDGGDVEAFNAVVQATPPYIKTKITIDLKDTIVLPLWATSQAEYAYKAVETEVMVAGKDRAPYIVPHRFMIECSRDSKGCAACPNAAGPSEYSLSWRDGSILQIIDCKEDVKWPKIRSMLGISKQCRSARAVVLSHQNVETLALYPKADWEQTQEGDNRYCVRKAYFLGVGIQTNATYKVRGITVPDAKDQVSVLIVVQAEPLVADSSANIDLRLLEKFRLTSRTSISISPKTTPESTDEQTSPPLSS